MKSSAHCPSPAAPAYPAGPTAPARHPAPHAAAVRCFMLGLTSSSTLNFFSAASSTSRSLRICSVLVACDTACAHSLARSAGAARWSSSVALFQNVLLDARRAAGENGLPQSLHTSSGLVDISLPFTVTVSQISPLRSGTLLGAARFLPPAAATNAVRGALWRWAAGRQALAQVLVLGH